MKPRAMKTTIGLVRIATAGSLLFAIVWQISDRLANNVFRPAEYFAYFTIDSSLVAAVTMAVAGVWALQGKAETVLLNRVRLSVASYAVVVGVVYNALLRGLPGAAEDGNYVWPQTPNEILHVWALVFIFLDFTLTTATNTPKFKQVFWVLLFPLAWVVFTILRGIATGWWPYWFLNPTDEGGVTQMVTYIFGICAFLIVSALASLGVTRGLNKLRK
jgi:hypothetical protein